MDHGIDRLSIRERPRLLPLMYQSWRKLLFMHWPLPPEELRRHVPPALEIDTFQGSAWIGITPFTVRSAHPVFLPPLPLLGDFNEVNVRTYVHFDGVPGVWFFSLDADTIMGVLGARTAFRLPYFTARMSFREERGEMRFFSARSGASPQPELDVSWTVRQPLGQADPGSLDFFLVERYCLYTVAGSHVFRARIHHPPWSLHRAQLLSLQSTMLERQGLPCPEGAPLLHYAERQDAAIWPLERANRK